MIKMITTNARCELHIILLQTYYVCENNTHVPRILDRIAFQSMDIWEFSSLSTEDTEPNSG